MLGTWENLQDAERAKMHKAPGFRRPTTRLQIAEGQLSSNSTSEKCSEGNVHRQFQRETFQRTNSRKNFTQPPSMGKPGELLLTRVPEEGP